MKKNNYNGKIQFNASRKWEKQHKAPQQLLKYKDNSENDKDKGKQNKRRNAALNSKNSKMNIKRKQKTLERKQN